MILFSGHSNYSQDMRGIDENIVINEVTDEQFATEVRTYIKGTSDIHKGLIKIFADNTNIILTLVYCFSTIAEYCKTENSIEIHGKNLEETLIKLKNCQEGMYIAIWNFIKCDSYNGYNLTLHPLDNIVLPKSTSIKLRKIFINNFLEDLC